MQVYDDDDGRDDDDDDHLTNHLLIRQVKAPRVITGSLPKASSGYGYKLGDPPYNHCHH